MDCTPPPPELPSDIVFNDFDIMGIILSYCDWPGVVKVANLCRHGRALAKELSLLWLRELLKDYMPSPEVIPFMDVMQTVGGGMIGSIPRRFLASHSDFMEEAIRQNWTEIDSSFDLNIVIPWLNRLQIILNFFFKLGFVHWKSRNVLSPYRHCVQEVLVGSRKPNGFKQRGCISISIARGSILEVMLAAPHAGQQNMFTSSRFYSAHPKEIGKYESLKTDIPMASVPRRVPSSFAVMADNMEWPTAKGVACGLHCPASQRKTADDKGMASFRYTKRYEHAIPQSRVAGTDYLLAQSSLVFRLCIRCRNKDCANYSPARESYKRMEIL